MAGNDWKTYRIQEIAAEMSDAPFGSSLKTKDYVDCGVLVIQGKNIQGRRFDWADRRHVTQEKYESLSRNHCFPGDLVFPNVGTIGKIGILSPCIGHDKYLLSTNTMRLRPNEDIAIRDYVYYFFCWNKTVQHIHSINSKSVQPVFNYTTLRDYRITLPPLSEQKAIAHILGTLDDKIELNRRMNETLEGMARAIFKSWFVDFDPVRAKMDGRPVPGMDAATAELFPDGFEDVDGELVPKGWKSARWGDIATLVYGKGLRDYKDRVAPYRVFGTNGPVGWHDASLCPGEGIIIGRKGAYRGVHYWPEPFYVIDTAFYLAPTCDIDLKWAFYELLRFDINSMDSGSAIPSTSREDFYGIPVCVPSVRVQRHFGSIVDHLFAKKYANEEQSASLAAVRDALLPKLLSGEIRIGDAKKTMEGIN